MSCHKRSFIFYDLHNFLIDSLIYRVIHLVSLQTIFTSCHKILRCSLHVCSAYLDSFLFSTRNKLHNPWSPLSTPKGLLVLPKYWLLTLMNIIVNVCARVCVSVFVCCVCVRVCVRLYSCVVYARVRVRAYNVAS